MDWTARDMYFPSPYNQQSNTFHELASSVGQFGATQVHQPFPPESYTPYANSYEPWWEDQPDYTWSQCQNQGYQNSNFQTSVNTLDMHHNFENQHNFQQSTTFVQPVQNSYDPPAQSFEQVQQTNSSLEDLIKQLAFNNMQFQMNTRAALQTLQTQLTDMTSVVSHNLVPSTVPVSIPDPVIGGDLVQFEESGVSEEENEVTAAVEEEEEKEDEIEVGKATQPEYELISESEHIFEPKPAFEPEPETEPEPDLEHISEPVSEIEEAEEAVQAEKQIISLSQHVSALIQPVPQKLKESGTFIHSCIIGTPLFHDCMFSCEASVNIMPTFIINSLGLDLDPLSATTVIIMHSETLTITFDDRVVCFDAFDAMSQPREKNSILCIDMIDELVDRKYMQLHAPGNSDVYNSAAHGLLEISSSYSNFLDADFAHSYRKEFQHIHDWYKWRKRIDETSRQHIKHLHDWDKWKKKPRRKFLLNGRRCHQKPYHEDRPGPYDEQDILLIDHKYPP